MFTRTVWILFNQITPALRGDWGRTRVPCLHSKIMAQKKNNHKINNTNYQSREKRVENKGKIRFHKTTGPSPTARHFPASFCQPVLQMTQLCSLDMIIVALSDLAALEEVSLSEQGKKIKSTSGPCKQLIRSQHNSLLIYHTCMTVHGNHSPATLCSSYYF